MEIVYSWVGRIVCWGVLSFALGLFCWWAWQHRPKNAFTRRVGNAWTWLTIFVFGRRWHLSLEGSRLLVTAYQPKKHLDGWERDTIAFMIRYSRRIGWKDPYR